MQSSKCGYLLLKNKQEDILKGSKENFTAFLQTADNGYKDFVVIINDYLAQNNCKCEIKTS